MDSVYKYSYCYKYRPGVDQRKNDDTIEPMGKAVVRSGFITNWCPSDVRDNWDARKHLGERLGWTDSNVKYRFNEYGFRHKGSFVENNNAIVALGCSVTFGIGVNYEQTWPYYVAQELGLDLVNLAQPGTGINASYRAAKMWLPVIKPKAVMFYVPNHHRREIWPVDTDEISENDYDLPVSVGPWTTGKYEEYFKMLSSKRETDIWREAYLDSMRWITKDSKYIHFPVQEQTGGRQPTAAEYLNDKIIIRDLQGHDPVHSFDEIVSNKDTNDARYARDMIHPGPMIHRENIAPLFIKAYNES